MRSARTRCTPFRAILVLPFMLSAFACTGFVYEPAPVVPTMTPLPYSAKVKLSDIEAYLVEPGATMVADPRLENKVTGISQSLSPAKKEWERSVAEYLAARKTFTYLSADSQTDLDIGMRLSIYIDPGTMFQFKHVYVARIDATLSEHDGKRPLYRYNGFGKAPGEVSRGGAEDDRRPITFAVQAALNDLFGKIENDSRLRKRGLPTHTAQPSSSRVPALPPAS
jgi:hypothetical protein